MSDVRTAEFPRFMIAAEKSGQGKTLITCALLELLLEQGMDVRAFKCGPDYIDPMFHKRVLGVPSYNLDSFFSNENELKYLLGRHGQSTDQAPCPNPEGEAKPAREIGFTQESGPVQKIGVIEGVMGYYDGLGGTTERASAYEIAKITKTPVILVADASGRSLSVLAAIRGFLSFRPDSQIAGVIFNRLSPMLYPGLKAAAERELGIRVIGFLPVLKDVSLESRHLGLVMPEEIPGFREKIKELAEKIRPGIDRKELMALACSAEPVSWLAQSIPSVSKRNGEPPVIAVAMDEAFCFYYQDNLDTLAAMNARLVFFSPIHDREIPGDADGLYLGGGYPELHGKALSDNRSMRESIRKAMEEKMPCIAECGGFLYLKEWLQDKEGTRWPMCGVLLGGSADTGRLGRFGYGTMTACRDGVLGEEGAAFPAHEFHHWDGEENGDDFLFQKPVGHRSWKCGYTTNSLYAGFPHLYFYGNFPYRFLRQAAAWKDSKGGLNGTKPLTDINSDRKEA